MASNDQDLNNSLAGYFRLHYPSDMAGLSDEDVIGAAKYAMPDEFGQTAWGLQHPVVSAIEKATDNPVTRAVSSFDTGFSELPKEMQGKLGILFEGARELNKVTKNASIGLENIADKADANKAGAPLSADDKLNNQITRLAGYGLGMFQLPEGPGSMSAALLGAGLSEGLARKTAITPNPDDMGPHMSNEPVRPTLFKTNEIAEQRGITTPGTHGQVTTDIINANKAAIHDSAQLPWKNMSDQAGLPQYSGKGFTIETPGVQNALESHQDILGHLPPELQHPALQKVLEGVKQLTKDGVSPTDGTDTGLGGMDLQQSVSLGKWLGDKAYRNAGTPLGEFYGSVKEGLMQDMKAQAPKSFLDNLQEGISKWKDYKQRFDNPHINKVVNSAPEKIGDLAISDSRVLNAIHEAGGEDALDQVRKSVGYNLAEQIANGTNSEKALGRAFDQNPDTLGKLVAKQPWLDTAKLLDDHRAINAAMDEAERAPHTAPIKHPLGKKIVDAVKKHSIGGAAALAGDAVGGPIVGGIAGIVGETLQRHVEEQK